MTDFSFVSRHCQLHSAGINTFVDTDTQEYHTPRDKIAVKEPYVVLRWTDAVHLPSLEAASYHTSPAKCGRAYSPHPHCTSCRFLFGSISQMDVTGHLVFTCISLIMKWNRFSYVYVFLHFFPIYFCSTTNYLLTSSAICLLV